MGVIGGPQGPKNKMLFCMDAANPKAHSPVGNTYFRANVGNVIQHAMGTNLGTTSLNSAITSQWGANHARLANGSHSTGLVQIRAVAYPSGNYGSDEGFAQGSSLFTSEAYDCDSQRVTNTSPQRAWNYHLWDYETSNWRHLASTADFNGRYSSGMGYDTYAYSGDADTWVTDYDNIKNSYPHDRFLHFVYGTHAHTYQNANFNNRLYDLGAPSTYTHTGTGGSWKEVILVGQPGLGAGNAYAWAYENGDEDGTSHQSSVAHLEASVYANRHDPTNFYYFSGTSTSYIDLGTTQIVGASAGTLNIWLYAASGNTGYDSIFTCETGAGWNDLRCWLSMYDANSFRFTVSNGSSSTQNALNSYGDTSHTNIYNIVGTYDGTTIKMYANGVEVDSYTSSIVPGTFTPSLCRLGSHYNSRDWNGRIYKVSTFNEAWSVDQVKQEFNAHRSRFGL